MRSELPNKSQGGENSSKSESRQPDDVQIAEGRIEWQRSAERRALNREGVTILGVAALSLYMAMWRVAPWLAEQIDGCCTREIDEFSWM
ncbi:hypothetical protein [Actinoplanes sp. CA-252034]|uniref:hypothetical protein n=1 Tax=Actinoplanes sp. CA-252034 TaxID=3239906 RepID=UPI003D979F30